MDTRSIVAEQARIAEENEAERQRLNALLQAAGAGEGGIGQVTSQQVADLFPNDPTTIAAARRREAPRG